MKENVISAENLSVGYGKKIVVGDIDFHVRHGEILTLIGSNGSGKSTILKSILLQIQTISGAVFINGKNIGEMSGKEISRSMSAVMTERIEPELMTCGDVVESGRYPYTNRLGILSRNDMEKVDEAMELVGVKSLKNTDFGCISDGQRQRVMLARAICQEPEILVLDEPTSFLDIHHKLELLNILKKLVKEKNLAVIMSLHELDLAQKVSDRIMCINNGRAEKIGTPEEIFSGDYISSLYNIDNKSFSNYYCSAELERSQGNPEIFVISGGGDGIPIYRRLQRMGIPFSAGVIHENDIEYPVLSALAVETVTEKVFEPISDSTVKKAVEIMKKCSAVINTCNTWGTMNRGNMVLLETAGKLGLLIQPDELSEYNKTR